MVQFAPFFEGLAKSMNFKKTTTLKQDVGREAAEEFAKEARKNNLMSTSQNVVTTATSVNKDTTSVSSMTGEKGVNQDRITLWKEFGCQQDMIFCGVFDGHGPWGHLVSKRVSKLLPTLLLWYWQETTLALCSSSPKTSSLLDLDPAGTETWRQSYLKACAAVDKDLEHSRRVNSFFSGTTALTVVKQGDVLIVANVGDSRAVLATTSPAANAGNLTAVQLTVDFKPNLPQEAERITRSQGLVCCSDDEPGVYRVWKPSSESPGLALSRAFGDHCLKNFGLISVPDVTARYVTPRDQFVILATDGVWDVISNQEAVDIVSTAPRREKSAKRLVKCAAQAWRCKRPGIAMDDISAVCLYLHHDSPTPPPPQAFSFSAKQSDVKKKKTTAAGCGNLSLHL